MSCQNVSKCGAGLYPNCADWEREFVLVRSSPSYLGPLSFQRRVVVLLPCGQLWRVKSPVHVT
jgi:hypothetical protein